jgi:hypothetical protein
MPAKYHGYVFDIAWYINNDKVALKERIPYTSLNNDEVLHRLDWDPDRVVGRDEWFHFWSN